MKIGGGKTAAQSLGPLSKRIGQTPDAASRGAMIEAQEPAALREDALEQALARLDQPVPPPPVRNSDLGSVLSAAA
jgi:hypothetical protein